MKDTFEYDPGEFITRDQVLQRFGVAPFNAASAQKINVSEFHVTGGKILSAVAVDDDGDGPAVWDPDAGEWDLL